MAIGKGHRKNFQTLKRAVLNRDVALMECQDAATKKPVMCVCAVRKEGEEFSFVPLAKLFDGNPYTELNPPNPDGGFFSQAEVWEGEPPGEEGAG